MHTGFSLVASLMNAPEILGNFPKWESTDGPAPFVWANKPPGHRCGWSCHWRTASPSNPQGVIATPKDWGYANPENMTDGQICAELEDYLYPLLWAHNSGNAGHWAAVILRVELASGSSQFLCNEIVRIRESYPGQRTFVSPFDPPGGRQFRPSSRPGWR